MSGHNKWSKIKHKKASTDATKSKVFSKHSNLITIESKKVDGDTNSPGLRAAIEKAKADNMPSDNIERAVKKGTGTDAGTLEEVLYEAYGPGGVGIIITGLTDNNNRTAAEIKHILSTYNIELAGSGAALWNFEKSGSDWSPKTTLPLNPPDAETLLKIKDSLDDLDDVLEIYTNTA